MQCVRTAGKFFGFLLFCCVIFLANGEALHIGGRFFTFVVRPTVAEDLEEKIRENAEGPAKASGDAGSVEQHQLTEQIEADRYLSAKKAAQSKKRGLRFNKIVPPGAS